MATQVKLRRGTTTQHDSFTGVEGEITVDTTKKTVVVHDGATAGGVPLAKESSIPSAASVSDVSTGTSTTLMVTPDALAGSIFGTKTLVAQVIDGASALTVGDGKAYFRVPSSMNEMLLVEAHAQVVTTASTGTTTIQVARGRQSTPTSSFSFNDMLSTRITIDATEYDSKDAAAPPVVDTTYDDLATGDVIRIDVDVVGTSTKGLNVTLLFRKP